MDVVQEILQKSVENSDKYKSITVDKYVEFDVGHLLAVDNNNLDKNALQKDPNDYLLKLTRDNTQLLFNQIWELPTERVEDIIVAKLPKARYFLPRFKPVPKPRPLTKWEQFAKEKGITKNKKSKLSWDEQLQKWVPLYGFKREQSQKDKDWLLEVPGNADPLEDQFEKKAVAKSENVAKNELQRLRNIAKAKKVKVPRVGIPNPEVATAKELETAVTVARASTASLGKFQEKLPKEKEARGVAAITPGATTRKRKLPPVSADQEKSETLAIVDSILNKKPKLNIEKAVAKQINEEQLENHTEKGKKSKGSKAKSSKKQNKSKSGKKPKSSGKKGKTTGGRKRR